MTDENKIGRPSKLTDELMEKAQAYLDNYLSNDDIVPSVAGLAVYLGVSKQTIYNYKEQNSDFLDTLEAINAKQEQLLLKGGLVGDFNSTITKLMLVNHGYSDKQAIDHTSSDGSMGLRVVFEDDGEKSTAEV